MDILENVIVVFYKMYFFYFEQCSDILCKNQYTQILRLSKSNRYRVICENAGLNHAHNS